jgi:hypothetical protein
LCGVSVFMIVGGPGSFVAQKNKKGSFVTKYKIQNTKYKNKIQKQNTKTKYKNKIQTNTNKAYKLNRCPTQTS